MKVIFRDKNLFSSRFHGLKSFGVFALAFQAILLSKAGKNNNNNNNPYKTTVNKSQCDNGEGTDTRINKSEGRLQN